MLKKLSDFLHRTPWWALIGLHIAILVLLGLTANQINAYRVSNLTDDQQLKTLLKREINQAYERVVVGKMVNVASMMRGDFSGKKRRAAEDAAHQAQGRSTELRNAKRNLAAATAAGMDSEVPELTSEVARLTAELKNDDDALRQIVAAALGRNVINFDLSDRSDEEEQRSAKAERNDSDEEAAIEQAIERAVEEATEHAEPASEAEVAADKAKAKADAKQIAREAKQAAREAKQAAREAVRAARDEARAAAGQGAAGKNKAEITFDENGIVIRSKNKESGQKSEVTVSKSGVTITADTDTDVAPPQPAAPPKPPAPPKAAQPAAAPALTPEQIVLNELVANGAKMNREFQGQSSDLRELRVRIDGWQYVFPEGTLPPALREELELAARNDFTRASIAAVGVPLTLLSLLMLSVLKIFADRARAALKVAAVKEGEAEVATLQQQITQAKLQALQAQIEPHFLYNTLANVQALTEVDPPAANRMVGHLIDYLRAALPKMRESSSTIGQELELVRAYLNILQMRMGKRLNFEIVAPEALLGLPFPPLMLPSLVENAIKHGLEPKREGGTININVAVVSGKLRVQVSDTGRGLVDLGEGVVAGQAHASKGSGVGLTNTRERLKALFGSAGAFTLEANAPAGVIATIEVPAGAVGALGAATSGAPTREWNSRTGTFSAVPNRGWLATQWASLRASAPQQGWFRALAWVERAFRKLVGVTFWLLLAAAATFSLSIALGLVDSQVVHLGPFSPGRDTPVGMRIVSAGLAFVLMALAAGVIAAVGYGVGWVLAIALLIGLIALLAGLSPVLLPLVIGGGLVWWWFKRRAAD